MSYHYFCISKSTLQIAELLLLFTFSMVTQADDRVFAEWVPPGGDAIVKISPTFFKGTLVDNLADASGVNSEMKGAKLTLLRTLEGDELDGNNPIESLRDRPLDNIVMGEKFEFEKGWWQGSILYDPGSGKTYKGRFQMQGENHLLLRGYVGVSLLGRTQVWTKKTLFQDRVLKMLELEMVDTGSVVVREKNHD